MNAQQIKAYFEDNRSGNHVIKNVNNGVVYVWCEYHEKVEQYCLVNGSFCFVGSKPANTRRAALGIANACQIKGE